MTRNTQTILDFDKLIPYALGFDRVFDKMSKLDSPSYPPFNIYRRKGTKEEESYTIEVAVAGIPKDNITIELFDNVLTVKGHSDRALDDEKIDWVHKGIGTRSFNRNFTIASDIVVASANIDNGILTISLNREVPEYKKPKQIPINS